MIKDTIWHLLNFSYDGEIKICDNESVLVEYKNNKAVIGAPDKASLARAFCLFAKEYKTGKSEFSIVQNARFKNCGVMLDLSRNGVVKVENLKKYIEYMAAHGLNTLLLYMEDIYEVDGYKYFGYMRGRYTKSELKEIDDYGYSLGVEVIPCVQFLGHLEQYFRWDEANDFKDTADIMMIGDEKTYQFIEKATITLRECFRTNKIHIGMDEAHNVGLGKYLTKYGFKNRFSLLNEHLQKVMEICSKYDFKPMMWSDMFFKLGSPKGEYYDTECSFSEEVIKKIPDIGMVYWDYYHQEKEEYQTLIKCHKQMGKEVIFAGGIWIWDGFLANNTFTYKCTKPAMEACYDEGVETVIATAWQDDGCETDHFMSLPGLAIISEYCYLGTDISEEYIKEFSEFVTGLESTAVDRMSDFHNGENGDVKPGKRYIWADFLYNMTDYKTDFEKMEDKFLNSYNYLKDKKGEYESLYYYASLVFKIAREKCILLRKLRKAYIDGDSEYLKEASCNIIPSIKADYIKLHEAHKLQWLNTYKPFGWEILDGRYATLETRADYAIWRISEYLDGKISCIEELDEEPLFQNKPQQGFFWKMTATSVIR